MRLPALPLPVVAAALKPFYRLSLNARLPYGVQRSLLDLAAPLQQLPAGAVVRSTTLAGRPAERITVGATERRTAVLYLHGGAYTIGSLATHRSLAAHLARESSSVVYTLDYRLAPEHPFPAGLEDAVAAYLELVTEHGFAPESIAVAGDSAGGGLALATARRLIDRHGVTPAALGLIAPWVDPASRETEKDRDLVINTRWSFDAAEKYLGAGDPNDEGYAPLHGNLRDLPPTIIHIGVDEVLYPQVMELSRRLDAAGVAVHTTEYEKLWHVAHLQASILREAADAVTELGSHLRSHMRVEPVARDVG
ncbi:alpha/beta hydrolase [Rhodococcus triatomae]|uniref:Acetyl esterase/lipase n=1 Tax=Rhodococcus triatomae TaxID=300028 RepID=A0A1G7Z8B5_9NOCA|nr:alpha/beta hydrolase [Rhodococcus triatomae]QNG18095.1 alpha/beta hydrolase [Rhodococcus triatomae]QNG22235.1 alpha/beta hydrolase [Rhodococcus triatomae]SDH05002.1 Acetyl esterase/lipase [Rhodococcus triatomae]